MSNTKNLANLASALGEATQSWGLIK